MLQAIRERAQGWVAWAIVILITIPFAFWGIDSYFGGGAEPVVATVNGTKITERAFNQNVNRTRMQLRDRLGDAYDPSVLSDARIREQVLDRMISETVLQDASQAMGLHVSDQAVRAAILSEPAFQQDGAFSKAQYERVLQLQGLTPAAFEDSIRRQLLLSQLPRAIRDTAFVTNALAEQSAALLSQRRELAYVTLPRARFEGSVEPPSEDQITAYYDAHRAEFSTPEQVRVSYLMLDADNLAPTDETLDDAALRAQYETRLEEFTDPEERELRHILISVPADADAAAAEKARERLAEIRKRILAGESFAELAKEISDDPGSASQGGDLGLMERGMLDPAFEQVAFELEPGVVSEPVRSRFGYHLIEVLKIQGGQPKPFEEVRDQLIADAASGSAEAAFFEQAEQLATLTYESPDSLIPAAEALGLEVQESDWLERGGGEGVFANPKVLAAAFSEEVLARGNNSELLEPDPDGLRAVVLRVAEHREASARPLDEVRDEIVAILEQQQAADAAMAAAESIIDQLKSGDSLETAADGFELASPSLIGRTDADVPAEVLALGFSMPRPGSGQSSYEHGATDAGDALVVVLSKVVDGDAETMDDARIAAESRMLASSLGNADVAATLQDMESRAKIERTDVAPDVE